MNNVNLNSLPDNLPIPKDDGKCNHLEGMDIPNISLLTKNGDHLPLRRKESFRMVLYFYPMTGNPSQPLPKNWNNIPGARGCTLQNCSFRDNYEEIVKLNALPIGITTQSIDEITEMTARLNINYDILSDFDLQLTQALNLPTFSIKNRVFIKRLTIIILDCKIIKVFYPIFPPNKHIFDILKWLKVN